MAKKNTAISASKNTKSNNVSNNKIATSKDKIVAITLKNPVIKNQHTGVTHKETPGPIIKKNAIAP
jgi:hypothetical protein